MRLSRSVPVRAGESITRKWTRLHQAMQVRCALQVPYLPLILSTAVSVRTPFVGVGGSILGGGYSWLSSEYGLTSDPANLLDAQVVKIDGGILWASEDPDLPL